MENISNHDNLAVIIRLTDDIRQSGHDLSIITCCLEDLLKILALEITTLTQYGR